MEKEFKILIADDEEVVTNFLTRVLRKNDYQFTIAKNGEEAVKKIEEDNFNLVFLDIWMPELNGVEVFKFIKKTKPLLPVVMMSSSNQWDIPPPQRGLREEEVKKIQPYRFLYKPLEIKDILQTINEVMKNSDWFHKSET